ncbi:transcription factor Zn, C2H2 [Fusarium austroafricanum]|uniref:Transcription factor Zn, C2H2 n=1 Tax=Fusarium austroafricanum TaxID=2364996 RepID=A0A8H4P0H3_9HYPO|nr:transcription factor Zn, C2H2 [Fusarium austroafricanum]
MTKASEDRLVALAGITHEFSHTIARSLHQNDHWKSFYLSGLWAGDIAVGLLWEIDGAGSDQRVQGFPTWSWASVVQPVVWQQDHRREPSKLEKRAKKLGKFFGAKQTTVNEQKSAANDDLTSDADLKGQVTSTTQFFKPQLNTLVMQGKLLGVIVSGLFDSDSDLDIAANLSGYKIDLKHNLQKGFTPVPETRTREYWRKISLSQFPEMLCGWASIDDPIAGSTSILQDIVASPLMKTAVDFPRFGLGYFLALHQIYNILLLRRVADGSSSFERIGVGRIFGPETVDELKSTKETTFRLV